MTNRQVLMTAILIMAISMSIAGTQDVFASHGSGPDDHSCSNNQDPEITGITPTIDGAIIEWIQDPTRTGRGGHHVCDTPVDQFEIDADSFSSTVSGTTFTETITGLECGEEYEFELTTDWDVRGQRDTSTGGEFETLSCVVIPDCSEDFGYNEETNQCIPHVECENGEFTNTETNTCEEIPDCEGDFGYNDETNQCIPFTECEEGQLLDTETNICEAIPEEEPEEGDCSRSYEDPIITSVIPTLDGAEITWIQDQKKVFGTCYDPLGFTVTSDSFEDDYAGDNHGSATITGLECGTEYEVEVATDWRSHSDTTDSEEYETLACEVEEEEEPPHELPEDCSSQYEDPVITSIVPTIDGAVVNWTQDKKHVLFWCFDPREFSIESGSYFEDHIEGDTSGTATITGLACGTDYDVEVATDWIFHSDTTDSDSYTTLACEGGGGGDDRHKTAPTSGNDWNTFENLVEGGITVDRVSFTLVDNWYTPFDQIQIETGSTHTFGVKTFAQNGGIMVQEIAFGISAIGDYANAEALVEVHYDWDKTILKLVVVQDTEVLNVLSVSTDQVQCRAGNDAVCYQTNLTIKFNEPLKDQVYAVKAFDMTRRTMMPHYFNEGINIFGDSFNPMLTMQIASTEKYEGLITITQIEKYSNLWIAEDGRIFDSDNYFGEVDKVYQQGYNDARGSVIMQQRADGQAYLASQLYFDSSKIQGEDGGFISYAIDLDGIDHREQTLQKLVSYNGN